MGSVEIKTGLKQSCLDSYTFYWLFPLPVLVQTRALRGDITSRLKSFCKENGFTGRNMSSFPILLRYGQARPQPDHRVSSCLNWRVLI